MKQFTLPLVRQAQRPTAILEDFYHLSAMLDTGAVLPVWVKDEKQLKKLDAVAIAFNQPFSGFGGKTFGTLYRLPFFRCGDLIYPNFPIIASNIDLPCQILIPATMFSNLIYEIDDYHHKLNITIPNTESNVRNMKVENKNGVLYVLCSKGDT
ncbi:MAG: hypothetical protein IKN43_00970 [Selenomonadaceae bacterium]|nr:hypothetical protein [Selenomonadaceae bacterium]